MKLFNLFSSKGGSDKTVVSNPSESFGNKPEPQEPGECHEANEANKANEASETKEARETARRIFNLIILDESGSMMSIYQPALTGVNETLQTIREATRENEGQEQFVTLVTFDTSKYNVIYDTKPACEALDITSKQYRPCGGTPLYDAMGRAITTLEKRVEKDDVVLVSVITDGYENASREFDGKAIKALIERMRAKGWIFTYIGANQDVERVASELSIKHHIDFKADDEGTKAMFEREGASRKAFYSMAFKKGITLDELDEEYFKE